TPRTPGASIARPLARTRDRKRAASGGPCENTWNDRIHPHSSDHCMPPQACLTPTRCRVRPPRLLSPSLASTTCATGCPAARRAQRSRNHDCYRGTADAAYQNIHVLREHAPTELLVLAGNHLCRMNYARLIDQHRRRNADVTLAYMELPLADAGQGGVLSTDSDHWVRTFAEKPLAAANGHDTAERALVSLGVYVFDTNSLIDLLRQDASDPGSWHDFGHDILPAALAAGLRVLGLPFRDAATDDAGYCRDVSTVDGYWLANMELL